MGFALSAMQLSSSGFDNGEAIPVQFTGEGIDVSPPLLWRNVPQGTESFAIFCHDPDAPKIAEVGGYGFVHWVLYNIPAEVTQLAEGVTEYCAGQNDFGNIGYGGPMPPEGHGLHRYYFWLLALDNGPELPAGLSLWELLREVEPRVLGMNRLVGTYARS